MTTILIIIIQLLIIESIVRHYFYFQFRKEQYSVNELHRKIIEQKTIEIHDLTRDYLRAETDLWKLRQEKKCDK